MDDTVVWVSGGSSPECGYGGSKVEDHSESYEYNYRTENDHINFASSRQSAQDFWFHILRR